MSAGLLTTRQGFALNLGLFSVYRVIMILPLVLAAWAPRYGLSDAQIGELVSLELLCVALASLSAPLWIARVRARIAGPPLIALMLLGDAVCFVLTDPTWLYLIRAGLGLIAGAWSAVAIALLARTHNPIFAFGVNVAAQFGFGFFAFLILPPLTEAYGGAVLAAALALVVAPALVAAFITPAEPVGGHSSAPSTGGGFGAAALALLGLGIFFVVQLGLWTYAERIGSAAGLGAVQMGRALAITSLVGAAGAFGASWIADRIGTRAIIVCICVVQVAAVWMIDQHGLVWYMIGINLFSLGWALGPPVLLGLIAQFTTNTRIIALAPAAQAFGMAMGPAVMAQALTDDGFTLMLALAGGLMVVFAGVLLVAHRISTTGPRTPT